MLQETLLPTLSRLSATVQANAFITPNSRAVTPRSFRDMNPLSLTSSPALFPELGHHAFITRGTEHLHSPPHPPGSSPGTICCDHRTHRGALVHAVTPKTPPVPTARAHVCPVQPCGRGSRVAGTLGTTSTHSRTPNSPFPCRMPLPAPSQNGYPPCRTGAGRQGGWAPPPTCAKRTDHCNVPQLKGVSRLKLANRALING